MLFGPIVYYSNKFAQLPTQTSLSELILLHLLVRFAAKASILLFILQLQSPLPPCRLQSEMADPDNSYSSGGGNDWELVSLTASAYAAAPGPTLPLLHHHKTDSPPPTPQSASAMFMSQHFNLPAQPHTHLPHYQQPSTPATTTENDADAQVTHLHISSCAKNDDLELDDTLTPSDFSHKHNKSVDDALLAGANGLGLSCSDPLGSDIHGSAPHVSADAATDATAHLSCLTPPLPVGSGVAISSGVACIAAKDQSKLPCQAWWKKTYSFLCNNAKEPLTFRFIFVAAPIVGLAILGQRDKLHLHKLSIQFHVDTEKISCSVGEPLGQVKGSVIIGGIPVAQG